MNKNRFLPHLLYAFVISSMCVSCGNKKLSFEETTFNTTESVRLLTGLSCIPKLEFREAVESPEFDFWYPDQWVTFNLTDSILSEKERFAIIDAARKGDPYFWNITNLRENAIAEYQGLRISSTDTIHYELVFLEDKLYLAYE